MGDIGERRHQLGDDGRRVIISTLPDPERHPLWDGIYRLLEMGARRSGSPVWGPEHIVWLAIEGRQIIAALSAHLTVDDEIEVLNAGGQRAAEWVPLMDASLCEWAGAAGVHRMICRGRAGWGRLSADLGWEVIGRDGRSVFYEKVLK
jgi:hypothetical protein